MQAVMETEKGTMTIELFEKDAPNTVANFRKLVDSGFYNGLRFHRVLDDFVIQGGCPHSRTKGDRKAGTGGPGWQIKCETAGNPHKHERGSLSMAHAGKDTGGSQFFICHSKQRHLDGVHTVFGKVVSGLDVIDKIRAWDEIKSVRVLA
ncbi:MAG TPA: peptidylprolyl isomerase [Candidatus Thermoplasmatota archaeon]|nr:peptidylprolyl isomerase [Candidatus Thermoplasmatota archaeon]